MTLIQHFYAGTIAALLLLAPAYAQQKPLRNEIGVSYTILRTVPNNQYVGAGLEYRRFVRPWAGVQVQAGTFPESQSSEDSTWGGPLFQANGSALLGHHWGKYGLFGEGGAGILRASVFKGDTLQGFNPDYDHRNYPDVIMGGLLDVSVGRRWSLTFNVRDNLTFVGAYTGIGFYGPTYAKQGTVNAPEGRAGVAFHF